METKFTGRGIAFDGTTWLLGHFKSLSKALNFSDTELSGTQKFKTITLQY